MQIITHLRKPLLAILIFVCSQIGIGTLGNLFADIGLYNISETPKGCFTQTPPSALAIMSIASGMLAVTLCTRLLGIIRFPKSFRQTNPPLKKLHILIALGAGLSAMIGQSLLQEIIQPENHLFIQFKEMSTSPLSWIAICLTGPIVEELILREGIQGHLQRNGVHPIWAILTSTALFSILHFNPAQSLAALPMGILFGVLYLRTGNILLCGALHILNNTAGMIQIYFCDTDSGGTPILDTLGSMPAIISLVLLSIILTAILLRLLFDYSDLLE